MIIKKKYTQINKIEESSKPEQSDVIEEKPQDSVEVVDDVPVSSNDNQQIEEEIKEEEKSTQDKINELDLTLDDIKFEQRAERREGTRRRGYRRSLDRNVISRAQKDAIAIKEQAKQEGYKEGVEQAKADISDLKTKFTEFFNYKDEVFEKVSDCILDISVEIAKKIIIKEIQADKEYLIDIIKNAVEDVNRTENKITLKVMPKDVELVKDRIPEIFSDGSLEAKISVIADNEIKEGGVIVETSNGIINASIESQLAIIEKALSKKAEG